MIAVLIQACKKHVFLKVSLVAKVERYSSISSTSLRQWNSSPSLSKKEIQNKREGIRFLIVPAKSSGQLHCPCLHFLCVLTLILVVWCCLFLSAIYFRPFQLFNVCNIFLPISDISLSTSWRSASSYRSRKSGVVCVATIKPVRPLLDLPDIF